MRYKNGFTLIELLITVSIVTIFSIIAFPSFSHLIHERKLAVSLKELSMTLMDTRSEALTIRQDVEVKLTSTGTNTFNIRNWNPSDQHINLQSGSAAVVTFEPAGSVRQFNEESMTFIICSSVLKKSKSLQLTRMGSLTILADGVC